MRGAAAGARSALEDNLAAHAWLWKDHTGAAEAAAITAAARAARAGVLLAPIGGTYSSEWFWSKIWHCLNVAPDVFDAAASWVELADFVPAVLAGVNDPRTIVRCVCAAGHKAMYSRRLGRPAVEGVPRAARSEARRAARPALRQARCRPARRPAICAASGRARSDLPRRHRDRDGRRSTRTTARSAPASRPARSSRSSARPPATARSRRCATASTRRTFPGSAASCNGSILPGYYGIEAGQSAVGDLLNWWVEACARARRPARAAVTQQAAPLSAGESGLLALDWNNGNRTILVDPRLTGLILGQTLHTSRAEIYRALIEATAFGARAIVERIREYGVAIERVVCCGGIAEKNDLFMQIYADVIGQPMLIAGSPQTPALGAAISAAVTAGAAAGGYDDWTEAQRR